MLTAPLDLLEYTAKGMGHLNGNSDRLKHSESRLSGSSENGPEQHIKMLLPWKCKASFVLFLLGRGQQLYLWKYTAQVWGDGLVSKSACSANIRTQVWISGTQEKSWTWSHMLITLGLWGRDTQILEAHWLASLSKNRGTSDWVSRR